MGWGGPDQGQEVQHGSQGREGEGEWVRRRNYSTILMYSEEVGRGGWEEDLIKARRHNTALKWEKVSEGYNTEVLVRRWVGRNPAQGQEAQQGSQGGEGEGDWARGDGREGDSGALEAGGVRKGMAEEAQHGAQGRECERGWGAAQRFRGRKVAWGGWEEDKARWRDSSTCSSAATCSPLPSLPSRTPHPLPPPPL